MRCSATSPKAWTVVDEIAKVKTGKKGMHDDVPVEPVLVKSAKRIADKG